jgi:predicted PurR-regulated permease PerM
MVVVAFLLAYIFDPIVTAIEVRGLSRTASTVVFFLFVISIAWILFSILAPVVYNQIQTHAQRRGVTAEFGGDSPPSGRRSKRSSGLSGLRT